MNEPALIQPTMLGVVVKAVPLRIPLAKLYIPLMDVKLLIASAEIIVVPESGVVVP